jgi:chromosome segregation ATPase
VRTAYELTQEVAVQAERIAVLELEIEAELLDNNESIEDITRITTTIIRLREELTVERKVNVADIAKDEIAKLDATIEHRQVDEALVLLEDELVELDSAVGDINDLIQGKDQKIRSLNATVTDLRETASGLHEEVESANNESLGLATNNSNLESEIDTVNVALALTRAIIHNNSLTLENNVRDIQMLNNSVGELVADIFALNQEIEYRVGFTGLEV